MKKIILLSVLLCFYLIAMGLTLFAQPIITSSNTPPLAGLSDSIFSATATIPPGSGGAATTWNLSALSLTYGGNLLVTDPSTTPYASTFPIANFSIKLTTGSSVYNYDRISSTGWETIATSYAGIGTGQDYSPNPRLEIPFPYHYLDSVIDTYQLTTGGPQVESLIYDGYGTLIMPWYTYTNVIRVKEEYGGSDYHYAWYTISPLMLILDYSNTGSNYIYISTNPATTGISNTSVTNPSVKIFPNPFLDIATLQIDIPNEHYNASLTITDVAGRIVRQMPINASETTIRRNGLSPGLYFYNVENNSIKIANGKFVIQ